MNLFNSRKLVPVKKNYAQIIVNGKVTRRTAQGKDGN